MTTTNTAGSITRAIKAHLKANNVPVAEVHTTQQFAADRSGFVWHTTIFPEREKGTGGPIALALANYNGKIRVSDSNFLVFVTTAWEV